jgi:putative hydroxymethylpyrimidine transport system substrate-binding protein
MMSRSRERRVHLILVAAITAALLAGCGDGSDGGAEATAPPLLERLGIALDGRVGPANVGVRWTADRGYFEKLGFKAESGSPAAPGRPVSYVAQWVDEFGVVQLPQLLIARDRGMPLIAIGSLVPHATAAMIWLKKSKIGGIADLEGKTIAIPGVAFQEALLGAILRRAGLMLGDVEVKRVGYELLPALLSGRADAIFGGTWNVEGAALEERGAEPIVKRVEDLGIPAYDELVVITRSDLAREDPELARTVMATVARGMAAVRSDPKAAVKMIEESLESSPELGKEETRAGVEATIPLLSPNSRLDPGQARNLASWMHEEGLIQNEPEVFEFLTNDYLPSP